MRSRLSILGLYRFDSKIFDAFEAPEGVDRETVIHRILLDCAELEVLFPDWEVMHHAIAIWSKQRQPIWKKLQETTLVSYDPIANYDRREEWYDNGTTHRTGDATTTDSGSASAESTQQTAGFNTDSFKPHDHDITSASDRRTAASNSTGHETADSRHNGRVWGNIGVTSTQQLLTQERDVSKFDMVQYIADDFRYEFCLLVY